MQPRPAHPCGVSVCAWAGDWPCRLAPGHGQQHQGQGQGSGTFLPVWGEMREEDTVQQKDFDIKKTSALR